MRNPSESVRPRHRTLRSLIGLGVKACAARLSAFSPLSARPLGLPLLLLGMACSPSTDPPDVRPGDGDRKCAVVPGSLPDSSPTLGCPDDFEALADRPRILDVPGTYGVKTIIDRADSNRLYFPDTRRFPYHYEFVSTHLSGNGKPVVPPASEFNLREYYTPDRRFLLGTLTHYTRPGFFAWEPTPSDNAGADMLALAYRTIAEACFCGKELYFHPTSLAMEAEARKLPPSVKVLSDSLFREAFAFRPFNNATGIGKLVFATAAGLRKGHAAPGGILVLDSVPDGFPLANGIITQAPQPPISPLNALAKEHGIPNMSLRGAFADPALRAREGQWIRLTVDPFGYAVSEATEAEAEAWREAHKPAAVPVPAMDTTAGELRDLEGILAVDSLGLEPALREAVSAYGGVIAHFAALTLMDKSKVVYEKSFAIPVGYYRRHMRENGLDDSVARMLADPAFRSDPAERELRLASLREAIMAAPLDSAFREYLDGKLDAVFPGAGSFRFTSSATAEGLWGSTGAGLYESRIGSRSDAAESVRKALLGVWAGVWGFRAFEERDNRNMDHMAVGMGVLVREAGAVPEAEGMAITANPYDPAGNQPGFYVNVGAGEASASNPDPSAMDQFVSHVSIIGQPTEMLARAERAGPEGTILTAAQVNALSQALWEIHLFFQPVYGKSRDDWYGMGIGFKLARRAGDPPGAKPVFIMESATPYQGWGRW
jgi:pyruvate,water dikinase